MALGRRDRNALEVTAAPWSGSGVRTEPSRYARRREARQPWPYRSRVPPSPTSPAHGSGIRSPPLRRTGRIPPNFPGRRPLPAKTAGMPSRASPAAAYRGSAGRRPPSTSYCATVRRESPSEPLSERETSLLFGPASRIPVRNRRGMDGAGNLSSGIGRTGRIGTRTPPAARPSHGHSGTLSRLRTAMGRNGRSELHLLRNPHDGRHRRSRPDRVPPARRPDATTTVKRRSERTAAQLAVPYTDNRTNLSVTPERTEHPDCDTFCPATEKRRPFSARSPAPRRYPHTASSRRTASGNAANKKLWIKKAHGTEIPHAPPMKRMEVGRRHGSDGAVPFHIYQPRPPMQAALRNCPSYDTWHRRRNPIRVGNYRLLFPLPSGYRR